MLLPLVFAVVALGSVPPQFPSLGQLTGKPVVINFWASWCHPCTDELSAFVKARETYGDRITIITVSSEPHDVAASYLRLWNIDLPLVEDLDGTISKSYAVPPVPLTVLVGADGRVAYRSDGELSWPELRDALDAALGKGPGSPQ